MTTEKAIIRIQKLLALGNNNPNEAEAFSALTLARKLMAEHNIHEVNLKTDTDNIISEVRNNHLIRGPWQKRLAHIIAGNFRCRMFYYHIKGGLNVCFFGIKTDGEIASEIFKFTINTIKQNSTQYGQHHGIDSKNDFISGFLDGLKNAFEEQTKAWTANSTALVLASSIPQNVQSAYQVRSRNFRNIQAAPLRISGNQSAIRAGFDSGNLHGSGLGRSIEG